MIPFAGRCLRLLLAALCLATVGAAPDKPEIVFRARVMRLSPEQPAAIDWTYGGMGLGGMVTSGSLTRELAAQKPPPARINIDDVENPLAGLIEELQEADKPAERVVIQGPTHDDVFLFPHVWSREHPIRTFGNRRGLFSATFVVRGHQTRTAVTNVQVEFEFSYAGKPIRRFTVEGDIGPVLGVMIPFHQVGPDGAPKPGFAAEVCNLREHALAKQALFRQYDWIDRPTPKLYAMVASCRGYGPHGFGIRTSDRATMMTELENIRLLGLNGTVGVPDFVHEMRRNREGIGAGLRRAQQVGAFGYIIPTIKLANNVKPIREPGDGCPYYPPTVSNLNHTAGAEVDAWLESVRFYGTEEVWARTVDEIGNIYNLSPEGRQHPGGCPYCTAAFREQLQAEGLTPADFGAPAWDDIRPTWGYWREGDYFTLREEMAQAVTQKDEAFRQAGTAEAPSPADPQEAKGAGEAVDLQLADAEDAAGSEPDAIDQMVDARGRLEALEWSGMASLAPTNQTHRLSPDGWTRLDYYTRRFVTRASGLCFDRHRQAFAAANARRRDALARGETDTPVATQPRIELFCLRSNSFLMGGGSLDFFEFYRYADTLFVYETSNRDRRVWQWDSYLCDVGRTLNRTLDKRFGIYIKPHRGAPIQRALAAIARGASLINWYAYGPEWQQGDSFGGNPALRRDVAWVSRLIGGAEEVTYDAEWALPAEVAVVRPLTSEIFSGSAAFENAKWIHTALLHAHIPVDALDEMLLMTEDLSRYKAIVISGGHIRRDVAEKLARWVEGGGTLYTSGWGLARDEAGLPLDNLLPVLGLQSRADFETWGDVPRYGATRLGAVRPLRPVPAGAAMEGLGPLPGRFTPVVGREVLRPVAGATVVARYADGGAAAVRHAYGKGHAWVVGPYAGVEYAWEPMNDRPFDADKRAWIAEPLLQAGVKPVVDASDPLVEGHLLRNRQTGALAVVLINWAFLIDEPVTVCIRGADTMKTARSVATGKTWPLDEKEGRLTVTLPKLDAGEILLLSGSPPENNP